VSDFLSNILFRQPYRQSRRIQDFTTYMTIEESGEDELVITEHPVQYGSEITDHAYKKTPTLNLRVQFDQVRSGMPLDEVYRRMLELQDSRVPFEVVTGRRLYKDMLFKSLTHTTDRATSNVLVISAQLKQIKITNVVTTKVPPREKQAQPGRTGATENAGQKKADPVPEQDQAKRKSALKSITGVF
jgi:hypothetical protein